MLTLENNKIDIPTNEIPNQLSRNHSERNQTIEPYSDNNSLSTRLMNTKIVRIHPGSICACVKGNQKLCFNINTISKIDNDLPENENETPLFYVEEKLDCSFCCFGSCKPFEITFEIFDANTKELFSVSKINSLDRVIDECCGDNYIIYAPILNSKASNMGDISTVSRHDSRSFYRTYDHLGQSHYKIGEPYVKKETPCCDECSLLCVCQYIPIIGCIIKCVRCDKSDPGCSLGCCCCCCCQQYKGEVMDDKRIYIDIFNMMDQSVGKFAYLFEKGACCQNDKNFYEIYFPPDATEMVRLALIAQIIFFFKFRATGNKAFISLPGSRDNIEQFMN